MGRAGGGADRAQSNVSKLTVTIHTRTGQVRSNLTAAEETWRVAIEKLMQRAYDKLVKSGKIPRSPI